MELSSFEQIKLTLAPGEGPVRADYAERHPVAATNSYLQERMNT